MPLDPAHISQNAECTANSQKIAQGNSTSKILITLSSLYLSKNAGFKLGQAPAQLQFDLVKNCSCTLADF